MIKAIIFDLVGVLAFQKKDHVPSGKDEINAFCIERLFNHIDDQKLIADIKSQLNLTNVEIDKALPYIPSRFELFSPLWNLLPKLKEKYRLAIVNNGNAIALNHWKSKFDFSPFELFINSGEEGIRKPDPEIFLLTCRKLGVKPEECLFMDDTWENIESAQKLGMKTIWWEKEKGLRYNFQQLLGYL